MESKIYVLDTNLPTIYGENINLERISKVFRELSEKNKVIISTNGWHEQALQVCELFGTSKINIISGGGSCFKCHDQPNFEYSGFLNDTDVDLILHLAIASYSGIFVKGRKKNDDNSNVLLNYFLNYQDAKEFKSIWKFNFKINNDYVLFEKELEEIDISEIYVYGNNQNFATKFLNENNNFNSLIEERHISGKCFFKDTYLFNARNVSKHDVISRYLEKLNLSTNDVIYISLGELENEGLNNYSQIILPRDADEKIIHSAALKYDVSKPDQITEILEGNEITKKAEESTEFM